MREGNFQLLRLYYTSCRKEGGRMYSIGIA
jgi:hypothetical protein